MQTSLHWASVASLTALLPGVALGGVPVLHPSTLEPQTLETWLGNDPLQQRTAVSIERFRAAEPPAATGFTRFVPCETVPSGPGALRQAAENAERAALYGQYDEARSALARAELAMGCASTLVDATLAARVAQLRGVLSAPIDAEVAFRLARSLDATLSWNDNDLPDNQQVWERMVTEGERPQQPLRVLPASDGLSVWVDGHRTSSPQLAEGRHFIQLEGAAVTSFWVEAGSEANGYTIVVPSLLTDSSLLALAGETGKAEWMELLRLSSIRHGPVELLSEGTVYRWEPDTAAITDAGRYGATRSARTGRLAGMIGGGLLAAGGAVTLGVSTQQAAALRQDARDYRITSAEAAERRAGINTRTVVGYSLLTAGVLGGGGLVLAFRDTEAGPGLELSGRW